jgi:hypothetical protein
MGAIKNYMMNLAGKLGKDFEDVTNEDIQNELFNQAQETFSNGASDQTELDRMMEFLPTKSINDVKSGNIGEVMMDNSGTFYLIVA